MYPLYSAIINIDMLPLFKIFNNFPQIPGHLADSLLDQWTNKYKSITRQGNFPNFNLEIGQEILSTPVQRISTFDPINHELAGWLEKNVYKSDRKYAPWVFRMLHIHSKRFKPDSKIMIYEKHLDSKNKNELLENNNFVLIYNMSDSVGDIILHQEENKPIIRTDRPVFLGTSDKLHQLPHETLHFKNCKEVARLNPAPRTWYLIRIDVIHSVENANQVPRAALQLRLSEREAEVLINNFN